ncbi:MAG: hypothetical protein M0R40_08105 [Firmicutes bacterium]|nr:hypothetical protein [Bacillota bacterium]
MSGTSSTGTKHRYYHCFVAKKKKTCDKKRISKTFIGTVVVDYTMQMLNDTKIVNQIVDNCFKLQTKENASLPAMESRLIQTQKEIDNVMNAIKQGIITPSTKSTLEQLEHEKENLEIAITKEQIERPTLSKEQIKYWICKFRFANADIEEQKKRLIDVFINAIYVYDDKVLVTFNCKDGEICATFDEINEMLTQKENADNSNGYQRSPLNKFGDP